MRFSEEFLQKSVKEATLRQDLMLPGALTGNDACGEQGSLGTSVSAAKGPHTSVHSHIQHWIIHKCPSKVTSLVSQRRAFPSGPRNQHWLS